MFNVPFEDLDIHLGVPITLEPQAIYHKVVNHCRGGFCYELNGLFHQLLCQLGYQAITINAQIIHEGQLGPRYDHMAIAVKLDGIDWLIDVGYGDLFTRPIAITPDLVQFDGFNYFRVKPLASQTYSLGMSTDSVSFTEKYIFQLTEKPMANFRGQCAQKQYSATSYFVNNLVCTKPTLTGRKTVFNNQLIIREGAQKATYLLEDKVALLEVLHREFAIDLFADQARLSVSSDTPATSPVMFYQA